LNGSQLLATHLSSTQPTANSNVDALYQAEFVGKGDYDWYSITAPAYVPGTNTESMLVSVWSINRSVLSPNISVYNSAGQKLDATVLTEDSYSCVLQVNNTVPGTNYYFRVNSNTDSSGDYKVAVTFQTNGIPVSPAVLGTFSNSTSASAWTLNLSQGGYMHYALSVGGTLGTADGVSMSIYDGKGNLVTTLSSGAGNAHSTDLYLAAGK